MNKRNCVRGSVYIFWMFKNNRRVGGALSSKKKTKILTSNILQKQPKVQSPNFSKNATKIILPRRSHKNNSNLNIFTLKLI